MKSYDYRAARDRIFGLVRDEEGKVKSVLDTTASITERALLLALVEWAPHIHPSQSTLAKMLGTDARSVRRLLRTCEAKGLLVTKLGTRENNYTNHYTLLCDPGLKAPPDAESPGTESPVPPDGESCPPRTHGPTKQTTEAVNQADKKIARSASRTQQSLKLVPEEPKETSEFGKLRDLYFQRFETVRGMKPPFDGRDGKAIKNLLAKCSAEQAAEAIEGAFRGWRNDSVTIVDIAKQPATFIGMKAAGSRNEPQPKQPNGGSYKPPVENRSGEF